MAVKILKMGIQQKGQNRNGKGKGKGKGANTQGVIALNISLLILSLDFVRFQHSFIYFVHFICFANCERCC